jgi:hypothetical protein
MTTFEITVSRKMVKFVSPQISGNNSDFDGLKPKALIIERGQHSERYFR